MVSQTEKRIEKILKERNIKYDIFEHDPVYTCEQHVKVMHLSSEAGVKSLIFKTQEGRFILVLSLGNKKVDEKKISRIENTKSIKLAEPKEVLKIAGCPVGCVPPFGYIKRIKTYLDKDLLSSEYIYFNPGSHFKTLKIKSSDLLKIVKPEVF